MYRLGPFELDHPFFLAPMAGITNSPYRRLMRGLGSSLVVSELVSANGIEYAGDKTLALLKFHESERTVGLQIFGEHEDILIRAAQFVEKQGADFVDLNLGCPVPKVVSKGAGAALCRNPTQLGLILEKMVKAVKIPVTIKIRTGWDANSRNAHEVVKAATDAGIAWVAIHGRTRAQGYNGEADWDFIGDVKAKASIPIIGNGDIGSGEMAAHHLRKYGVDAVMIGRAALRNPFIFEQAKSHWKSEAPRTISSEDYLGLLKLQRTYLEEAFPDRYSLLHARKFLAWYASGFPGCHDFRRRVFSTPEADTLWNDAYEFFDRNTRNRDMGFLAEPFLMGGHG